MEIDILTLFPDMFAPLEMSMIGRARQNGRLSVRLWDIREYAVDRHRTVDDKPYGGGPGMVMKPEPVFEAVKAAREASKTPVDRIVLFSPQGQPLHHDVVLDFAREQRVLLICGHYEGFDERIRQALPTDEISIGDYVLTGGELPAMVFVDAVARFIPGVLGDADGAVDDSFFDGLLEYPQYTRPRQYESMSVPDILLSGDHERIRQWRRFESIRRTWERRPELLEEQCLTEEEQRFVEKLRAGSLDDDEPIHEK